MKSQFETAARDVHESVHREFNEARSSVEEGLRTDGTPPPAAFDHAAVMTPGVDHGWHGNAAAAYKPPKKNWRLKRAAVPAWYKQRNGVRTHAQSGAARVARFRPRRSGTGSAI